MYIATLTSVTDAILTATNVTEDDYDEWSNTVDYSVGDYVISTTTHTVYRCLVAHGVSDTPVDPDAEAADFADPLTEDPATQHWQIIGATNLWKLFDEKPSVQCTNSGTIEATLEPGVVVDVVGLRNLDADSVTIVQTDPTDGEVYNETVALVDNSGIANGYDYYFAPLETLTDLTVQDLMPYQNAEIDITITSSATAKCGQIAVGTRRDFGTTIVDGALAGVDFSSVDTDIFGNLETTRRPSTVSGDYTSFVSATRQQALARVMNQIRGGEPALFIGADDDRLAGTIYGYARNWKFRKIPKSSTHVHFIVEAQGTV